MKIALKMVGAFCLFTAVLSVAAWWLRPAASEPQESAATAPASAVAKQDSAASTDLTIATIDFDDSESAPWRTVNDTVMGGISQSTFRITPEGTGVFSGDLSLENNGGFSSVRREMTGAAFAGAETITVRVKGDGRAYQLRFRTSDRDRAVSYRAEFDTVDGEWATAQLPLSEFEPVFRGRIVEDAPELSAEEIVEVGFLLADKQPGSFRLEVDWIRSS